MLPAEVVLADSLVMDTMEALIMMEQPVAEVDVAGVDAEVDDHNSCNEEEFYFVPYIGTSALLGVIYALKLDNC